MQAPKLIWALQNQRKKIRLTFWVESSLVWSTPAPSLIRRNWKPVNCMVRTKVDYKLVLVQRSPILKLVHCMLGPVFDLNTVPTVTNRKVLEQVEHRIVRKVQNTVVSLVDTVLEMAMDKLEGCCTAVEVCKVLVMDTDLVCSTVVEVEVALHNQNCILVLSRILEKVVDGLH